jgi:hypothetical protein
MVLFSWGALSDERAGLSFIYAVGPRQRRLSRVRVPWDSWPYFTVSVLRLLFFRILSVRVRVTLRLTVSQSVSHGAHDQILIAVWQLLSCPWESALSDERTGLSFVSQSAVLGQLSVCTIFTFYMCHMLLNTHTIYTRPLSVRAQYSRLCPISGSFAIRQSSHLNGRMLDRRQVPLPNYLPYKHFARTEYKTLFPTVNIVL